MGSDPFQIQPDGSALYALPNGNYIYSPPDAGPHTPGDQSLVKIVGPDKKTPVPGIDNKAALAQQQQYEGAGANYGTTAPPNSGLAALGGAASAPGTISGQPTVGTDAASNPTALLKQANGTFYDPTTGRSYTDSSGTQVVADPNLAQQTAASAATGGAYGAKVLGQDATLDQVNGQQGALVQNLKATIAGTGAPSAAQAQLAQATDNNAKQILGAAAGVGGTNAYDAKRQAIQALAGANTSAAGNAATLRANEVNAATTALGSTLNQQSTAAQNRENTNVQAAQAANSQAADSEAKIEGLDEDKAKANQSNTQKYVGAGLSFLSGVGSAAL